MHHIHDGKLPEGELPVTFGLLLNLVGVMGEATKEQVWGYLANYVPEASAEKYPELDRLIDHALAYARDFVAPTLQRRAPEPHEAEALRQLDAQLAALPEGATAEDIQNIVYEIGKTDAFPSLRDWFKALYETLLGSAQGPRMGSFIALYGVDNSRKLIAEALAKARNKHPHPSGASRLPPSPNGRGKGPARSAGGKGEGGSYLAEMFRKERHGAFVRQLGGLIRTTLTEFGREAVIFTGIIIQRDLGVIVQPLMHPLLRILVDEVILLADMEQDRLGDGVLLAQQAVDADAIIADTGIHIGARRGHEGQPPAQAIADDADLEVRAMLVADRLDRRFDIANAAVLVELAHQVERLLHLVGNVGSSSMPGAILWKRSGATAR